MSIAELCDYAEANRVEMYDEHFYFNDDRFMGKQEVFSFGSLYDDSAERIYAKGHPLFAREDVQSKFCDYAPYVVGKAGLLEAIAIYEEKVRNYYNGLLSGKDGDVEKTAVDHIKRKIHRFSVTSLANTKENNRWTLTNSWEFEHSIFNLIHILKTLDWDKETLLFYGA